MPQAPCAKCQQVVSVSMEVWTAIFEEAERFGAPFVLTHPEGECPSDAASGRRFKVRVEVVEMVRVEKGGDEETLARFASDWIEAPTFTAALAPLAETLSEQWERVQELVDVIDMEEEQE